jgi:hypothetical protein
VLGVEQACDYVRQAALGLQHAFEAGLVHRDIKPGNLLIARADATRGTGAVGVNTYPFGQVKILDMGLARMESMLDTKGSITRDGVMMGTPDYVAPEQARDAGSADIRADLYSLGATFYFMLVGRPPFPDGSMIEKLMKHQQQEPEPIGSFRNDVPDAVAGIVCKLMAKDPSNRFQTPIELAQAILSATAMVAASPAAAAAVDTVVCQPSMVPASDSVSPSTNAWLARQTMGNPDTPTDFEPEPEVEVVTSVDLLAGNSDQNSMRFVGAQPAQKLSVVRGHKGPVMAVTFSPDCKLLATGGLDRSISVWSLGRPPRDIGALREVQLGEVQVLAFDPSSEYLVSGSGSIDARMIRWSWRESLNRDRCAFDGPGFSDALAFSAVGSSIWLWSTADNPPRKRIVLKNHIADVKAVRFAADGRILASGDADGVLHLWKTGWLGMRPIATHRGHRGGVSALAFSSDSNLLAAAGLDHTIRIWDGAGADSAEKASFRGTSHGVIRQLMFLPDNRMLLSASDNGYVSLWRWSDGACQHQWKLEQPIICSVAMASDGCLVAAGSTDGTVTIYDLVPET